MLRSLFNDDVKNIYDLFFSIIWSEIYLIGLLFLFKGRPGSRAGKGNNGSMLMAPPQSPGGMLKPPGPSVGGMKSPGGLPNGIEMKRVNTSKLSVGSSGAKLGANKVAPIVPEIEVEVNKEYFLWFFLVFPSLVYYQVTFYS